MITACQSPSSDKAHNASRPFGAMMEAYYQDYLKLYPLEATAQGDNRYNDQLPNNLTKAFKQKEKDFYSKYLGLLEEYDPERLSPEDAMSYNTLKWQCEMALEGLEFPTELMPVDQFWSLQITIGQLASGSSYQPFETPEDYDNWLNRMIGFLAWTDTAMVNMKKGMEQGYVLPRALTEKVIPQFKDFTKLPVKENIFYSPIMNLPDSFSALNKTRLINVYHKTIELRMVPTFEKFVDFLENEYLPASRNSAGITATPMGADYYKYRIKYFTTTEMTADEVFVLGESEVARISAEMEKVKEQVGFEGELIDFFEYVRTKPELMPYTEPEQVIEHFNEIHERMKPNLNKLFSLKPKTPFVVKRTEAFREASASAEYIPGSLDGSRPGTFYVPIPDVTEYNIFSDESLFLHEAIPGHHYQISLQQENEDLPSFRKSLWYSAYGEGWALYSESLGQELGLYTDPYQYFGMLSAEIHRAIRLVVDAGIHAKGWTREQAIRYSLEHEAESEASIISEIERYMAGPGQALSYKIGQLKIRELRKNAQEALGEDFDVKEFHARILESGCVPLQLLEDKVNNWVNEERK